MQDKLSAIATRLQLWKAKAGDVDAAYQLGYWYEDGNLGLSKDANEAIRYYKQAQQLGHPEAAEALRKLQSK
ncbi:hypothetical protein hmeg3_06255 [Herbaspirillum sp. meg3]|uniref:SEL1-like repeat protein n=1 Tax=Herbaspirillum sp. meg3 TaxID=2025949 RepID=UPI000B989790|nr:SEL1-like repeat protein [Herbaspirillum sp. meg3]ASU37938.1 hypothetical protein hmeg3_06255 [Herbaspirillum sp. meg3]